MKFTKEDAVKELTAKITPKVKEINKWERTIKENVETLCTLLGDDSEIELDDFISKAIPLFDTTAGFIRKENADFAKSSEDKYKNADAVSKEPKKQEPTSELEMLKQQMEALTNKLNSYETEKKNASFKQTFLAKMKEKGINEDWTNKLLEKIKFDENVDIDSEVSDLASLYNKQNADTPPNITPKKSETSRQKTEDKFNKVLEAYNLAHPNTNDV